MVSTADCADAQSAMPRVLAVLARAATPRMEPSLRLARCRSVTCRLWSTPYAMPNVLDTIQAKLAAPPSEQPLRTVDLLDRDLDSDQQTAPGKP